jgi:hypothetical protein
MVRLAVPTIAPAASRVIHMRSLRSGGYLVLSLGLGLVWFCVLATWLSAGFGLALSLVGLPVLAALPWGTRAMAQVERGLTSELLGVELSAHYREPDRPGLLAELRTRWGDTQTWRDLTYLLCQFPLGVLWFVLTVTIAALSLGLLLAPLYAWWLPGGLHLGDAHLDTVPEALAAGAAGVVGTWGSLHAVRLMGDAHGRWAQAMLAGPPASAPRLAPPPRRPSGDPQLRASDAERESVVGLLNVHCAAGRLSAEELDERVDAALKAKTRGDLNGLLRDLPGP